MLLAFSLELWAIWVLLVLVMVHLYIFIFDEVGNEPEDESSDNSEE
jgi:hypothetical protein